MQQGEGAPFSSEYLNSALRMHIMNDESSENSTRLRLQEVLSGYITLNKGYYPAEKAEELKKPFQKVNYQNLTGFRIISTIWA